MAINLQVPPANAAVMESPTETETATPTPEATETPPPLPSPSETPAIEPASTETSTAAPIPTDTPTATFTPGETPTTTATFTAEITSTLTPTATDTPLMGPLFAASTSTELFFSEYVEGSSSKALEIYNGTGAPIDLSAYQVELYSNGSTTASQSVTLSGILNDSNVFVLAHGDANVDILAAADLTNNSVVNFNGDDTIVLKHNGLTVDVIGQIGFDPGTEWGSGLTSTANNTLRRKSSVQVGDINGGDGFDPAIEWDGFAIDTFTGLGTHFISTSTPTPTPPPIPGSIIINEVAWGGTTASSSHEWIELYNTTSLTFTLTGWVITNTGSINIPLSGSIGPNDYYLIERGSDTITDVIVDITAELTANFVLPNTGSNSNLFLSVGGVVIDTANADDGPWPAGVSSSSAGRYSMERINASFPESDTGWSTHKGCSISYFHDVQNNPIFGTPGQANSGTQPPLPASPLLISEFVYDGVEFVEICNPEPTAITNLSCYKIGDEETSGGSESMYRWPITATMAANSCQTIAKDASAFTLHFGYPPSYTLTVGSYATSLIKYPVWANGSLTLANDGDELLLLGPNNEILDSVAYRNGNYAALGLEADASAPEPLSLQRVWPTDTNSMPHDFVRTNPNPGERTIPPPPPATIMPPAALPDGMYAYWGDLHAHTTYSDGSGPPHYALAMARAAGLHFQAITDHDWWLNSLEWAKIFTQTTSATIPGQFVALRGVEWTHDAAGHINVFNTGALLNSRTNPMFSTLPDFYSWLAAQPDVIAQFNHPDPSYGGTFFNFAYHPAAAQVMFMQEIGNNAQKYTTYEPSFVQSNMAGWRVGPTNNSDHHQARWGSQSTARTGLVAPALTESDLLAAMRARRIFATEDSNLAVALRLNGVWMGSSLTATGPLSLTVDLVDPDPEPLTLYLYDGNLPLVAVPLESSTGQWTTTVKARPGHFFWVKVVQADGQTAYTAPVWVEGQAAPEKLVINEILPAPYDHDWDKDGTADYRDEWIELYNPTNHPIGLGGWQLADSSGAAYNIPLDKVIPAHGFAVFYHARTQFSLNNDTETVSLTHPNGAIVDTFTYHHSPGYDESYCRLPDAGTDWSDNCGPSPQTANWEKVPAGPLTVKIYDAKRLTYNAWVRVKGHVTAPPGVLGARTMYIQDNTSGIMIYLPKDHRLSFNLGDRLEVVGHLRTFHEEFEIVVSKRGDIGFLEPGAPLPPLPIATTSLLEPYEGMLVMLQGQAVDFKGRTTLWIDDGSGWAKTTIRKTTGIKKPFIKRGDPLTMVGIVSQYSDKDDPSRNDYRLLPRYQTDLFVAATVTPAPTRWPALLPETGY